MTNWAERSVLVTGATGFLGSWLVEALCDRGAHVVCLDIPKQGEELAQVAN